MHEVKHLDQKLKSKNKSKDLTPVRTEAKAHHDIHHNKSRVNTENQNKLSNKENPIFTKNNHSTKDYIDTNLGDDLDKKESQISRNNTHNNTEKMSFVTDDYKIREESQIDLSRALKEKNSEYQLQDKFNESSKLDLEGNKDLNRMNITTSIAPSEASKQIQFISPEEPNNEYATVSIVQQVSPSVISKVHPSENLGTHHLENNSEYINVSIAPSENKNIENLSPIKEQDSLKQKDYKPNELKINIEEQEVKVEHGGQVEQEVNTYINNNNIEENKEVNTQEDTNTLHYEFFNGLLETQETQDFYSDYLSRINDEQKVTFKIPMDIKTFNTGITPRIIFIYRKHKELVGVAVFSYDNSHEIVRLSFNHFSTTLFEQYEEMLLRVKEFVLENFIFEELIVNLYYNKIVTIAYLTLFLPNRTIPSKSTTTSKTPLKSKSLDGLKSKTK